MLVLLRAPTANFSDFFDKFYKVLFFLHSYIKNAFLIFTTVLSELLLCCADQCVRKKIAIARKKASDVISPACPGLGIDINDVLHF